MIITSLLHHYPLPNGAKHDDHNDAHRHSHDTAMHYVLDTAISTGVK